jgi:hypothetical protein
MKSDRNKSYKAGRKGRQASQFGPRHGAPGKSAGGARNGTTGPNLQRYLALAREAEAAGDRVQSEYYYQHAEHYHRKSQKQD